MLDKIKQEDCERFAGKYCQGLPGFNKAVFLNEVVHLKRMHRGAKNTTANYPEYARLQQRWYDSLAKSEPDFSVYNDIAILPDIWTCWALYSRMYLKSFITRECEGQKMIHTFGKVMNILDIGNGIGYSSAALTHLFPFANVFGYNIKDPMQWKICEQVAEDHDFFMVSDLDEVPEVDLLFASEYFEHYDSPIDHLKEVLMKVNPRNIIVANSFGTHSVGHFTQYAYKNGVLSGRETTKTFNIFLKDFGYKKMKTTCWNDRPSFWQRK